MNKINCLFLVLFIITTIVIEDSLAGRNKHRRDMIIIGGGHGGPSKPQN